MKLKSVETKNYHLEVKEVQTGYEVVLNKQGKITKSEVVRDYLLASYLFEVKLQELEGH